MKHKYKNIQIERGVHNTVKITNNKVVYVDPIKLSEEFIYADGGEKVGADLIICTHLHSDHYSPDDIKKIVKKDTELMYGGSGGEEKPEKIESLGCNYQSISTGELKYFDGVEVAAIPAYNVNKYNDDGQLYHPKEMGGVGVVIRMDKVKIYISGDTDKIPEMARLENIDIAFLPVSGVYVTTAEEAAHIVKVMEPKIAIPMHYGDIVGDKKDAEKFKDEVEKMEINTQVIMI